MTPVARQFVRFLLVGLTNTAISMAVYRLLDHAGVPYAAAAGLAFAAGAVNGYLLNRRWTFASAGRAADDTARARVVYLAVQAAGLGATSLITWAAVHGGDIGHTWAYLVAVPPVTVATFLANRWWTFRPPPGAAVPSAG